jgi:hypothetical protein
MEPRTPRPNNHNFMEPRVTALIEGPTKIKISCLPKILEDGDTPTETPGS